jgi:CubicO group peptidase (beta-lactamase class C family)
VATGYQPRFHPMTPLFRILLPKGVIGDRSGRFVAFNRFYVDGPAYGGLVGPVSDAARFVAAHLNGGEFEGVRLLRPESVQTMQSVHASGRKLDVGYGCIDVERTGPKQSSGSTSAAAAEAFGT